MELGGYAAAWLFVVGVHLAYVNILYTLFIGSAVTVSTLMASLVIFSAGRDIEFAYTFLHVSTAIILSAAISGPRTRRRAVSKGARGAGTLVGLVLVCAVLAILLAAIKESSHGRMSLHPAVIQFFFLKASVLYHLCTPQDAFARRVWFFVVANVWCAVCATGATATTWSPELFVAVTTGAAAGIAVIVSLVCGTTRATHEGTRSARTAVGKAVVQLENLFAIYYVEE